MWGSGKNRSPPRKAPLGYGPGGPRGTRGAAKTRRGEPRPLKVALMISLDFLFHPQVSPVIFAGGVEGDGALELWGKNLHIRSRKRPGETGRYRRASARGALEKTLYIRTKTKTKNCGETLFLN